MKYTPSQIAKQHLIKSTRPDKTYGSNREQVYREIKKGKLKASKMPFGSKYIYMINDNSIERFNNVDK